MNACQQLYDNFNQSQCDCKRVNAYRNEQIFNIDKIAYSIIQIVEIIVQPFEIFHCKLFINSITLNERQSKNWMYNTISVKILSPLI